MAERETYSILYREGLLIISAVLEFEDIAEFERAFVSAKSAAQAIEARRAETRSGSVEDESAVPEGNAP